MRVDWKQKALSALSLVLIISMLFTSGLSTVAAQAASGLEKKPKTVSAEPAVLETQPNEGSTLVGTKVFKGLNPTGKLTLMTAEKATASALQEKAEEKEPEKTQLPEETKASEKKESPGEDAAEEKSSTLEGAPKEESLAIAEDDKAKPEAEKEAATDAEKPAEEDGKAKESKEETKVEDKKEDKVAAGPMAADQAEITIKPSSEAEIAVETAVADPDTPETIVTGDKVDKGTKIKVTVTPQNSGDFLILRVGDEQKEIRVPGTPKGSGAEDKVALNEADTKTEKGVKEDTDTVDSGKTPVKKIEEKEEVKAEEKGNEDKKETPTLMTISAEADTKTAPKAKATLGDTGDDLAPQSFEFTVNKDVTIDIISGPVGDPYATTVYSTTQLYGLLGSQTSFILADNFIEDVHNSADSTKHSWADIVTLLAGREITLSTSNVAIAFAGSGQKLGDTTFVKLALVNADIPTVKINATTSLSIGNGSKVGEVNQSTTMLPAAFTVGTGVEIASLKEPYPDTIGTGSKIKLFGDAVTAGVLNGTGTINVSSVSVGGITVNNGATWNVDTAAIAENITFDDDSIIGAAGSNGAIAINAAGTAAITVGSTATGKVNINNYKDNTSGTNPVSEMGTVKFETSSGAIDILAQLVRGKNTSPGASANGGTILAKSATGKIKVGTSGNAHNAGSLEHLNIEIGTGTVDVFGSANTITSTALSLGAGGLITVNSQAGTVNIINANSSGTTKLHDVVITQIGATKGITSIHGNKVDVNITNTGTTIGTVSAQGGLTINAPQTAIGSAFLKGKPTNPTIVAKSITDYYLGSDTTTWNIATVADGTIHLTIPSTTTITNIHMGGEGQTVTGSPLKLTFTGGISGSVFMGGNGTTAGSNTNVDTTFELGANTIGGSIYGGSRVSSTTKSSTIILTAGTVAGNVYGGAYGAGTTGAATITALPASLTKITGTIYGGGREGSVKVIGTAPSASTGKSIITLEKDVFPSTGLKDLIFGGSERSGKVDAVEIAIGTTAPVTFAREGNIYGGGDGTDGDAEVGTTKITFVGNGTSTAGTSDLKGSLFGGSKINGKSLGAITIKLQGVQVSGDVQGGSAAVNPTGAVDITIGSNSVSPVVGHSYIAGNVYGGGAGASTGTVVTLLANTYVNVNLFGGGKGGSISAPGTKVDVEANAGVIGAIYGGGHGGSVAGGTIVNYAGVIAGGHIYGGSLDGNTSGSTVVNINSAVGAVSDVRNIYGGNQTTGGTRSLSGGTAVNINNAVVGTVYGGGAVTGGNSTIGGGTKVVTGAKIKGSVYGGEYIQNGGGVISTITGGTDVNITTAVVSGPIYGGSYGDVDFTRVEVYSTITGGTKVHIDASVVDAVPGPVYGGSHNVNVGTMDVDKTVVDINKEITSSVFGGGHSTANGSAKVSISTEVNIGAKVKDTIYGGGEAVGGGAVQEKATLVTVNNAQTVPVYGGGLASGTNSYAGVETITDVQINAAVTSNVYGGGRSLAGGETLIAGKANVTLNSTYTVVGFIYGGGHGDTGGLSATAANTLVTLGNAASAPATTKVTQSVYGGGFGDKSPAHVTGTAEVAGEKAGVSNDVYGGGHAVGAAANVETIAKVSLKTVTLGASGTGFVYGGGHGAGKTSSTGATEVTIDQMTAPKSVYGGGHGETTNAPVTTIGAPPTGTGITSVTIGNGTGVTTVTDSVYGGGRAVAGNATVIQTGVVINSDAEITGTVYGGGHSTASPEAGTSADVLSIADGSNPPTDPSATNVSVGGKVLLGVYGGGFATGTHTANVAGGTLVKVLGGADITKNVYGGGRDTAVGQTAKVDLTGGTVINDNIYGGGHGEGRAALTNSTKITVNGGADATATAVAVGAKNVYGGGFAESFDAIVSVQTEITAGALTTTESVYGGGHALGGSATVGNGRLTPATTLMTLGDAQIRKDVYGGGHNLSAVGSGLNADIKGSTKVLLKGKATVTNNVYGGGHAAVSDAHVNEFSEVILEGSAAAKNVFGGGHAEKAEAHIKNATSGIVATNVTIQGDAQVTLSVYGGGYSPAGTLGKAANILKGGTKVTVTGAGTAKVGENVYGGGHSDAAEAKVAGNTTVLISKTNSELAVAGTVFGGGRGVKTNAEVAGDTNVTVTEKSVIGTDVYGGGQGVTGLANIVAGVNAAGTANVTLGKTAKVMGSIYGGGRGENGAATIKNITNVTIDGAAYGAGGAVVETNVYGGGHGLNSNADILGGLTNVNVTNAKVGPTGGTVYGGGRVDTVAGTAKVPGKTVVNIKESHITKDVYGGGIVTITPAALTNSPLAEVTQTTSVTLGKQGSGEYEIGGNVYGGGHNAHVNKETNVKVFQGVVASDVFGGGHGFAQVNLPKPTTQAALKAAVTHVIIDNNGLAAAPNAVNKSVYGGGRSKDADINGSTEVTIQPNAKILLDLYGGGRGSDLGFDKSADVEPDTSIGYLAALSNVIWGGTKVNIKGWIGQDAYAGGQHQSHVMGDDGTYIMLDQNGYVHRDLHGGGRNSTVLKDTETIVASGGTANRDVYGGTANHKEAAPAGIQDHYIGEHTLVTIRSGGTVKRDVYGAGDFSETRGVKGTTVDISGHVYRDVYGGGNRFALVLGVKGTKVDIYPTGLVGQPLSNPDPKHESNYPSFDFDDDLNTVYNWPSAGHVYGGGSFNSHVAMATPTPGQGEGTNVTVHAKGTVRGVVFGGGKGSNVVAHDPAEGNANVLILGYVGRVHGGGRVEEYKGVQLEAKTFDTTNGTKLQVTGPSAIVFTDAYGGGFGGFKGTSNLADGALNLKADVLIDNGSNVRFRVFGGGNQFGATTKNTTDVVFTGETTVIGHAKELFAQTRDNAFITGWLHNTIYKADDRAKYGTDYFDRWMYYRDAAFTSLGSIYGGGNRTSVGVSTNIDIGDNTQIALNFVSGGNIGVKSLTRSAVEIPRTIQIGKMGVGDLVENSYTHTSKYGLIRVLGDYTEAVSKDSYLTVYYHLDGADGGKTTVKTLIEDDAYQPTGEHYKAEMLVDTGIYHPWRPEPHTVVRVEPTINMVNGSKFRMQYGYTIKLRNGIFPESAKEEHLIALLMDLPVNPASTSKIYAPKDNVLQGKPFHYKELPFTIEKSRLQDVGNEDQLGLRLYFPSNNVDDTGGKNTNTGGKDRPDKGTGNSGGWGGGWSSDASGLAGAPGGTSVGVAPSKVAGATGTAGYLTAEGKVVSQDEVLKNLQTVLGNSKTNVVTVNERLAGQVSGATLTALAQNAAKAGKSAIYQGDTVRGNRIEGRMSIDTLKSSGITGTIKTGVYTSVQMTKQVGTMFAKFFQNRLSVVRLAQEGPLGAEVKIAAYVNLNGMNASSLHFYAYSTQNNNFQRMPNPRYSVDKNGYLHFYTNVGGHIIITDKPLVRK